jgi:hypothetical protein
LSFVLRNSSFALAAMHFTDLAIQIIADDKIRSAIERGEFDRLPGLGRPLHFDAAADPDWWIRRKLREEDLTTWPRLSETRMPVSDSESSIGETRPPGPSQLPRAQIFN